ncbi:MAG: response regulator, partial [Planctomycetota bacterium]
PPLSSAPSEKEPSRNVPLEYRIPDRNDLILVADDQDHVREVLCRTFRRQNYSVLEATNGKEALRIATEYLSDLTTIILDIDMPELDGLAVLRELRELGYDNRIVLVTGLPTHVPPQDPKTLLLKKPVATSDLLESVTTG